MLILSPGQHQIPLQPKQSPPTAPVGTLFDHTTLTRPLLIMGYPFYLFLSEKMLCNSQPRLFVDYPRLTALQHVVDTSGAAPIKQPPYRVNLQIHVNAKQHRAQ